MKKIILILFLFTTISFAKIAVVSAFVGEATINRNGKILNITLGSKINKEDQISTKDNTKLQLLFNDNTMITIGKNAYFSILEYIYDEDKLQKSEAKFNFKKGFFRTVTGQIGKINPKKFNIKIKSATLGIRGTRFDVFVSSNITKAALFDGKIFFKVNNSIKYLLPGQMVIFDGTNIIIKDGVLDESKELYKRVISKYKTTNNYNDKNTIDAEVEDILEKDKEIYDIETLTQKELNSFLVGDVFENIKLFKTPTSIINTKNSANYTADIYGKYTDSNGIVSSETGNLELNINFTDETITGQIQNLSNGANKFNTNILTTDSVIDNESFNAKTFNNNDVTGIIGGYYYGNNGKVIAGGINLEHTDDSKFDAVFIGKEE